MKKIKEIKKAPIVYIGVSVLCLITFIIYNQFSHGVTSPYMTYLFAWPLLLGFVPYALLTGIPGAYYPGRIAANVYNSGVASITVSSLLKGIFDIAGNSSIYQSLLMSIGVGLLMFGVFIYLIPILMMRNIEKKDAKIDDRSRRTVSSEQGYSFIQSKSS